MIGMSASAKNDLCAYYILYKFLKENGILYKYLDNVYKEHNIGGNSKVRLLGLIAIYHQTSGSYDNKSYPNLFNWAPSAFFFDKSNEGAPFWVDYIDKWVEYYNKQKVKYGLE